MKQRYKMIVAYDGSAYHGWQIQPKHATIQGEMEKAICKITGNKARVHSSGRTDTGVHARGQVVHVDLTTRIPTMHIRRALNSILSDDIRIVTISKAAPDFHARKSAVGKEYRYLIWNHPIMNPFLRHYRAHVKRKLDITDMNQAASQLIGEHDFAAFSANPNREIDGTIRIVNRLDVKKKGNEICIIAQGNGFLYKMVRSLAGFLIRVGGGEVDPGLAKEILQSKVRTARVPTGHPQGLFLWKVFY